MLSKVLSKLLLPMKIRGTVHRFFFELTPQKSQIFRRDIDPAAGAGDISMQITNNAADSKCTVHALDFRGRLSLSRCRTYADQVGRAAVAAAAGMPRQ